MTNYDLRSSLAVFDYLALRGPCGTASQQRGSRHQRQTRQKDTECIQVKMAAGNERKEMEEKKKQREDLRDKNEVRKKRRC